MPPIMPPRSPRISRTRFERPRTKKSRFPYENSGKPAFAGLLWIVNWWRRGGSNSRPPHCERGALPAELRPHGERIIAQGRRQRQTSQLGRRSGARCLHRSACLPPADPPRSPTIDVVSLQFDLSSPHRWRASRDRHAPTCRRPGDAFLQRARGCPRHGLALDLADARVHSAVAAPARPAVGGVPGVHAGRRQDRPAGVAARRIPGRRGAAAGLHAAARRCASGALSRVAGRHADRPPARCAASDPGTGPGNADLRLAAMGCGGDGGLSAPGAADRDRVLGGGRTAQADRRRSSLAGADGRGVHGGFRSRGVRAPAAGTALGSGLRRRVRRLRAVARGWTAGLRLGAGEDGIGIRARCDAGSPATATGRTAAASRRSGARGSAAGRRAQRRRGRLAGRRAGPRWTLGRSADGVRRGDQEATGRGGGAQAGLARNRGVDVPALPARATHFEAPGAGTQVLPRRIRFAQAIELGCLGRVGARDFGPAGRRRDRAWRAEAALAHHRIPGPSRFLALPAAGVAGCRSVGQVGERPVVLGSRPHRRRSAPTTAGLRLRLARRAARGGGSGAGRRRVAAALLHRRPAGGVARGAVAAADTGRRGGGGEGRARDASRLVDRARSGRSHRGDRADGAEARYPRLDQAEVGAAGAARRQREARSLGREGDAGGTPGPSLHPSLHARSCSRDQRADRAPRGRAGRGTGDHRRCDRRHAGTRGRARGRALRHARHAGGAPEGRRRRPRVLRRRRRAARTRGAARDHRASRFAAAHPSHSPDPGPAARGPTHVGRSRRPRRWRSRAAAGAADAGRTLPGAVRPRRGCARSVRRVPAARGVGARRRAACCCGWSWRRWGRTVRGCVPAPAGPG